MEDRERVRPSEPEARPDDEKDDVELHGGGGVRPASNIEPGSEGKDDDDVELHGGGGVRPE